MLDKIKIFLVLLLVIIAAYIGQSKIPILLAHPSEISSSFQTAGCPNNWTSCYQASLALVAKNAHFEPRIEITHVPPFDVPYPYIDYDVVGKVLNVASNNAKVLSYYERSGWILIGDTGGENVESDGSFVASAQGARRSQNIRIYIIRRGYSAPTVWRPLPEPSELPPNPPNSDVFAMAEIKRTCCPDQWEVIKRLP